MKTLEEIQLHLADNKKYLSDKYPIEFLAIFASYAQNEANENSDLDILVEFNDKIGIRYIDFADELENLLELKIDLVSKDAIKDKYF